MGTQTVAAVFDFDKTLLVKDSAELGFKALWREGQLPALFGIKVTIAGKFYRRHWMSAETMSRICLKYYRGRRLAPFVESAEEFYRTVLAPSLSPAVLAKLEEHRAAGHFLVLISASIEYLLTPAVRALGFDALACTRLEVDARGVLTGGTQGPMCLGVQKRVAMERLAAEHGFRISESYAYADHHSDAPLLEAVGHPVCVRPTAPLRRIAAARGWDILDAV